MIVIIFVIMFCIRRVRSKPAELLISSTTAERNFASISQRFDCKRNQASPVAREFDRKFENRQTKVTKSTNRCRISLPDFPSLGPQNMLSINDRNV
jgi:hypothetical protein